MFQLERDFVKTAKAELRVLSCPEEGTREDHLRALEAIITSAKTVNARAVRVAAERCVAPAQESRLSTAFELRTLSRLTGQFEDGLLEIDVEPVERVASAAAPAVVNLEIHDTDSAARIAADTLETVIPFAPAQDAGALKTLMRLARGETEAPVAGPAKKPVFLESLIAPVTGEALVTAHRAHKQVSLSYACEDITVPGENAPVLQTLILDVCTRLIESSLRHGTAREAAGLPATGQIALTATQTARGLTLDVYCDDLPADADALLGGNSGPAWRDVGGDVVLKTGGDFGVMLVITHSGAAKEKPAAPRLMEAIA